jgi:hypothetical protein
VNYIDGLWYNRISRHAREDGESEGCLHRPLPDHVVAHTRTLKTEPSVEQLATIRERKVPPARITLNSPFSTFSEKYVFFAERSHFHAQLSGIHPIFKPIQSHSKPIPKPNQTDFRPISTPFWQEKAPRRVHSV